MSSSLSSSPIPRVAMAAAIGFTALTLEYIRRRNRGPIRETPPQPEEIPHHVFFGKGHISDDHVRPTDDLLDPAISREDQFFWLRDDSRKSEKVLDHLRAENAYTNYKTLHLRGFSKRVNKELLSHLKETDSTVPASRGKFSYYTRTVAGKSYKYYCRRPNLPDGALGEEDIMLDVNALAARLKYCDVAVCQVSPDDRYLAYSIDTSGYETYEVRFIDLMDRSRVLTAHSIGNTTGSLQWGRDSKRIFYHTMDDAHRPYKIWLRDLDLSSSSTDSSTAQDTCLYTESDTEFIAHSTKSRSGRFLFIGSYASMTTEHRFIDLDSDRPVVHLIRERVSGVLYDVAHARGNDLYIVTNVDGATNFKLMRTSLHNPNIWLPVIPYDAKRKIDDICSFQNFAVVTGREGGYQQMWIVPGHDMSKMYELPTDDVAHIVKPNINLEYETTSFRYTYGSLIIPRRTYDIDVSTRERTLLKEEEVPGYDASLYATERIEAVSDDGTRIPISLVYRRDDKLDKGNSETTSTSQSNADIPAARRVLLYGYGSYEISMEPSFSMERLPLLDRGVVYAIAHIRGGGEFGREWYEAARLKTKRKTFEDFISCAQHLIDCGRTRKEWLAIEGRSAGGLLVGAVLNMRPDLFRAAVAGIPFVDVLNTMSDASLPLTTGEWQEWGNPHTKQYFDVIRAYCPYSNIVEKEYPAMLVLAGLFDPRVHYAEPTKYVAKLRKTRKVSADKARDILLKVDLSSGHFSASNRYHYLKERSFELAWMLNELGLAEKKLPTS